MTSINLPPITLTYDDVKKWCWTAPNGATGTHETTAVQAASVAISGLGIPIFSCDLSAAKSADEAKAKADK